MRNTVDRLNDNLNENLNVNIIGIDLEGGLEREGIRPITNEISGLDYDVYNYNTYDCNIAVEILRSTASLLINLIGNAGNYSLSDLDIN